MSLDRKVQVLGIFPDEAETVSAIEALGPSPWKPEQVHSPFPSHRILDALKLKRSRVGYFTLCGGILGFVTGLFLARYTALQWNLIVSGKPIIAWLPFFIVGFEFTILFSVLGNIIGFLVQSRLPQFKGLKHYDPRFSGDRFGILASCAAGEEDHLLEIIRKNGGEAKIIEE